MMVLGQGTPLPGSKGISELSVLHNVLMKNKLNNARSLLRYFLIGDEHSIDVR